MTKTIQLLLAILIAGAFFLNPVQAQLTTVPDGGNKKADVSEQIGLTKVSISYSRPHVKGREGQIWGKLIYTGFQDLQFGSSKSSPWRAGANENTIIEFSTDVKIEGQSLAAGKYGFFIAYDPNECTLIFSKNISSWGSFYYDPKDDVLRVKVKPVALDRSVEWLKYEFINETDNAATVALEWEKLMIPFKVETDLNNIQLAIFRKELTTSKGFQWQAWNQAATWCLQNNFALEQGLLWADSATSVVTFGGGFFFQPWAIKSLILTKLGRTAEADATMKKGLPLASMNEVHQYARQLLTQKRNKEAFDVFKMNYDKNPGQFTTIVGMARGYSALGDYKNALTYAQKALPLAPNEVNKTAIETMITKLKDGKDGN